MKRFCSAMFCSRRASRSLNDVTSGFAARALRLDGRQVVGRRARMCAPQALSGAARDSPNQTSRIASGGITNCGRITPDDVASARLSSVSPTCTSTAGAAPGSATVSTRRVVAAQQVVAEHDDAWRRAVLVARQRHVGFARDQLPRVPSTLEAYAVDVVRAGNRGSAPAAAGDAVHRMDLRASIGVGLERAVERAAVRDRLREDR